MPLIITIRAYSEAASRELCAAGMSTSLWQSSSSTRESSSANSSHVTYRVESWQ